MTTMILQMLFCLLLAGLLGFLLGWILRGSGCKQQIEDLERTLNDSLEDCRSSLAEIRAERDEWQSKYDLAAAHTGETPALAVTTAGAPDSDPTPPPRVQPVAAIPATDPERRDDLTRIEGIGPKIAELLQNAGIHTWAKLAATDPATVKAVLQRAGERYRIHDPTTWPEQAQLAAEGRWAELDRLQDELDGGRR